MSTNADEVLAGGGEMLQRAAVEERRTGRVRRQARLQITPRGSQSWRGTYAVELEDVSARGVGFIQPRALRAGEQFTIRLPRLNEQPLLILCTVRQCRHVRGGQFRIGAEFTRVLSGRSKAESVSEPAWEIERIRRAILEG